MPDPAALHARRGAHWTFNGAKFVQVNLPCLNGMLPCFTDGAKTFSICFADKQDLTRARATGTGLFPSFDHHVGDPIEKDIAVRFSRDQTLD